MNMISTLGYDFTNIEKPLQVNEANINNVTLKEIVDWVAYCLILQGTKSVSVSGGVCMYRGENKRKCAVGHLISDKSYSSSFEHNLISGLEIFNLSEDTKSVMERLQWIHDTRSPEDWPKLILSFYGERDIDTEFYEKVLESVIDKGKPLSLPVWNETHGNQ